jgi:putative tryptophan/tyrosine transport system substrate-binding protein
VRRRDFLTLAGGAAVAWPVAASAQQAATPLIGHLNGGFAAERLPYVTAFGDGLKEAGFVDGRNVRIEYRWAESEYERLPALAADLVRRQVAVIFSSGAVNSSLAAKAATTTIPIVFVHGSDPVEVGLVSRLNHPGGNVTGVTVISKELEAKRLEVLRELVPNAKNIGLLVNPSNPNTDAEISEMQALADANGWRVEVIKARNETELDTAFAAMAQQKVDVFLPTVDALFGDRRSQIAALAVRYALPGVSDAHAGGLMSYSASLSDAHRQAGVYVGRILKGEKPGDLPILLPTKFELVINLKTAKALGINVPLLLQQRADEIIE